MADDEEPEPVPLSGLYASVAAATQRRRSRRRKQLLVGLAGALAVLAGAGFLVSQLMRTGEQENLPEPAALAPWTLATSATAPPVVSDEPFPTRTPEGFKPAKPVERSPAPSPEMSGELAPGGASAGTLPEGLAEQRADGVSERTETLENGTIRIVTGRRDLTGQRELRLAGDGGQVIANGVRCTTDVRLATGVPMERRPVLLLCWRTSATRSVITLAVVPRGVLPTAPSVAVIGREWARLG